MVMVVVDACRCLLVVDSVVEVSELHHLLPYIQYVPGPININILSVL